MSDSPIFIGGCGRSGTTLLVDLLGLHPRISPIYETDFVVPIGAMLARGAPPERVVPRIIALMDTWTAPLPHRPHNKRSHERYVHGPHHILFDRDFALEQTRLLVDSVHAGQGLAGLRRMMNRLFSEHCRLDDKPRWANKTPAYVHLLPVLHTLHPDMTFVHCVRDGRDVACSVVTRPWGPSNFTEAAGWWSSKVLDGLRFAQAHPERHVVVRYEDLLSRPESTLEALLERLGEEDPGAVLDRFRASGLALEGARSGAWEEQFDGKARADFAQRAGPLLEHLGYAA